MEVYDSFAKAVAGHDPCFFYLELDDIDYLLDSFNFEMCCRILPLEKQVKIRRVRTPRERCLKLLNSLLVSYIVAMHERQWVKLEVGHGLYGKPRFENRPYTYNISDERAISSVCISFAGGSEIGADLSDQQEIESFGITPDQFYSDDFKEIFTEDEADRLKKELATISIDDQWQTLASCWAQKESQSKLAGYGLHKGLQRYPINLDIPLIRLDDPKGAGSFKLSGDLVSEQARKTDGVGFVLPDGTIGHVVGEFKQLRIIKVALRPMVEYLKNIQYTQR